MTARLRQAGRRVVLGLCVALLCQSAALSERVGTGVTPALREDFETGGLSDSGGLFYKDSVEQRAGLIEFQGRSVHGGKGAVTLSALPSCRDSMASCAERAELWERPEMLARFEETVWYGFAVNLEDPLPQDDRRYVIAQWKRESSPGSERDYSPFLALRLYEGRLGFTVETDLVEAFPIGGAQRPDGCRAGEARVLNRSTAGQTRALVAIEAGASPESYPAYFDSCAPAIAVVRHADLPSAQKGWIDFVVQSRPGPAGDGHVEILADGVHIATVKGPIGHDGPGLDQNQYFKMGPYRGPNALRWSVSYDDFRRGPRCTDVIGEGQCPPETNGRGANK